MPSLEDAQKILQTIFNYPDFRSQQKPIVSSILKNQHTIAILATGGGKSICFQVPGLLFKGTTLVISPLISLMQDQVYHLKQKKIAAGFINSSLNKKEQKKRINNLAQGKYKFIYLAPERLKQKNFIEACQKIKIPMIVIDEAHCISLWGHDFRPSYQKIKQFINKLKKVPLITAFTATATQAVIKDICHFLGLNEIKIINQSASRTNLIINIYHSPIYFIKNFLLFSLLKQHKNQNGIIYTVTRKAAEELVSLIKHYDFNQDYQIAYYHGGMAADLRKKIQEEFINNHLKIIVATNAFGMGVDKSNVRFVIHYQIPANLENYSQEIGRAGRDQKKSFCYLLYYPPDLLIQQQFIRQNNNLKRKKIEIKKLKIIKDFIEAPGCYQKKLAHYFNYHQSRKCAVCNYCQKQKLPQLKEYQFYFEQLQKYFQDNIKSPQDIYDFPEKTLLNLALHQPKTKNDCLKIAGIGQGWIDKWYQQFSQFLVLYKTKITLSP